MTQQIDPSPQTDHGRAVRVGELVRWVAEARPGARLVYGRGFSAVAAAGPLVRDKVQALHAAGLLTPHVTREEGRLVYLVRRSAKPFVKGTVL